MKKSKNRILSLVLCAACIMGTVAPATLVSANDESVPVAVQMNEHGYASEEIGNIRVQILSPTLIRLEEKGPKGFEDRKTFHISNRDNWEGTEVTREDADGSVILRTSAYDIVVPAGAEDISGVTISDKEGKLIWKYKGLPGSKVYLPDPGEKVNAWEISDTPRMTVPDWGFTPQPDENTENRETNGFDQSNDAPDMYVFLPAGDAVQLRKDLVKLTGQTDMLSLSTFGAWDSRYYAYSEATAMQQIKDYHETYRVPLDNLVIDTDWRKAGTGGIGYDVNTDLFPDMEGFLQKAHDENVNIIFNDHPEPTKNSQGQQNSAIIPQEIEYRYSNLTRILGMGMDSWWYDRNWSTTIIAPNGFTHEAIGGAVYADAQKAVYPDRRLVMMSNVDGTHNGGDTNAPDLAQHRYGITWTGDIGGHQEILQRQLEFTVQYSATAGLPYISDDIGSHQTNTNSMTADEYVKWMQYGTLSPIYRPHCTWVSDGNGRMPWLKGENALNIIRDYVNLRYRLLPTFYNLSHENYETGMPLVRRLDFYYPDYESADRNDQYLLGDDILVAPTITNTEVDNSVPSEWLHTPDGDAGLRAEYFNNKNLSGEASVIRNVKNINFDWGDNAPVVGINADNFSIRYTGTITIGDQDVKLQTCSDDGARIYINDELFVNSWKDQEETTITSEGILKAGETYNIRYEYYDAGGGAICKLLYESEGEKEEAICTRTVWIPEGEWIDTFSGETIYGPQSIEVAAPVSETPIYVKKGAVLPLADEMMTTKEKDWSHMTLDVYPSTRYSDTTTLYEDDTESNDYQDGKFRTTEVSQKFENGKTVIDIGAAKGTFDGALCFNERSWTVRIHQPEGWGALKSVTTADGQALDFQAVEKDASAMPFEVEGGAADGTVYEVEVSGNVYEAMQLVAEFENAVDPEVPALEYDEKVANSDYKEAVERTVEVTEDMPYVVNLTSLGNIDWIQPNINDSREITRKDTTDQQITFRKNYANSLGGFNDYCTTFSYDDGMPIQSNTETRKGSVIYDTNGGFEFQVRATEQKKQLILFVGGWKSEAKLEVFDKSANTKIDTYTFGNSDKSYYRKVTIDMTSATGTDLVVKYTKASGTGNVTFAAAALRDPDAGSSEIKGVVEREVEVLDWYPEKRDLTAEGNVDWIHLGQAATNNINRKAVMEESMVLTNSHTLDGFHDHKTAFSWSDGSPDKSATDLITGLQQSYLGSDFTLKVKAGPQERILTMYIGGWKGKGKLTVYDESGVTENQVYTFGDLNTNFYRTVVIKLKAEEECNLRVRYSLEEANGGNVSWVAATLYDPTLDDTLQLKPTENEIRDGVLVGVPEGQTAGELKTKFENDISDLKIVGTDGEELSDDAAVYTGCKVQLFYEGIFVREVEISVIAEVIPGDVDRDGVVNVLDLVKMKMIILGRDDCTDEQMLAGDINNDGVINIIDLVMLKMEILAVK